MVSGVRSNAYAACAALELRFLMQEDATLPRLTVPHDVFRQGLGTLKDDIGSTHVVESIQQNVSPSI